MVLNSRYGEDKSFQEETFISELVNEVHPDLQNFFTLYVEGKNQWKPNDQLNYLGIKHHDTFQESSMLSPFNEKDNDITILGTDIKLAICNQGTCPNMALRIEDPKWLASGHIDAVDKATEVSNKHQISDDAWCR